MIFLKYLFSGRRAERGSSLNGDPVSPRDPGDMPSQAMVLVWNAHVFVNCVCPILSRLEGQVRELPRMFYPMIH